LFNIIVREMNRKDCANY